MSNRSRIVCRACDADGLLSVLDLGETPLANALLTASDLNKKEERYPLKLVFCPTCALVQITETVPPEKLFRNYFYLSSFSSTMLQHAEQLVEEMVQSRSLNSGSLVIEVASNDGYLLQYYKNAGVPVLGIEPAENIAHIAETQKGIPTVCDFFGANLASKLAEQGKRADVIHAHNVLAHVADLNGFVGGLSTLLKDNGVAIIEVPYVRDMIDGSEFDTIYHEHLCYFSLTSLNELFTRHQLQIHDVERLPIHGGTLRLFGSKAKTGSTISQAVTTLLEQEKAWGVNDISCYENFGRDVECLRHDLITLLLELKQQGKRLAVYGASAKGSTLLNYFGIGPGILDFVVDKSTLKQGYFTPGTHLPIYSPDCLLHELPDYVLLLTWNFADEILEEQAEYQRRGGRFIIPIPKLRITEPKVDRASQSFV